MYFYFLNKVIQNNIFAFLEILAIISLDFITQEKTMSTLVKSIIETTEINNLKPDFSVLKIIPKDIARQSQTLIFSSPNKHSLQLLTTNNFPEHTQHLITQLQSKGYETQLFYTTNEGFSQALNRYEELSEQEHLAFLQSEKEKKADWKSAISFLNELYEKRDTMEPWKFIKEIIRLSFQAGTSDLHFQAEESGIFLRLRLDGVLMQVLKFTHEEFRKYMQKIKFISGVKMNIDYIPQDGRFSFQASDKDWNLRTIDARISFMPGIKTESIVIRFLDAQKSVDSFEEIWLSPDQISLLEDNIHKTSGIIIITGPTWSWKTTTLYTTLKKLNDGTKKIITLEDPIEYKIAGLQQSQINYDKGYDYETGFKAILRQDPDIILVGETRTKETAQIAINASLTGHLVFTTLHTNSVFESLSRLMNMGIEPYLLTPALQLLLGQRLVRKVCPHCGKWDEAGAEEDMEIRKKLTEIQQTHPELGTNYQGKIFHWSGCEHCNNSGYLGRIAILEILEINDEIRAKLMNGIQGDNLLPLAKSFGFISMQEDWILKVVEGITDLKELHRVLY